MHNDCPIICTGNKTRIQQGMEHKRNFNLGIQDKVFSNVVYMYMYVIEQVMVMVGCGILLFSLSNASQNRYNPFRISIL